MNAEELAVLIAGEIETIQADIDAHEERLALQAVDDGKTTTERAQEALTRGERFRGEHEVARAWLRCHADRIWTRL